MKSIIFLILIPIILSSQPDSSGINTSNKKYYFSVAGGLSYIFNNTSLPIIPGADDCGTFTNGDDLGYYAGVRFGYNLIDSLIITEIGLIYENRPVSLQKTTNSYQILSPITNSYEDFVRLHEYTGSLQYIDFEAAIKIQPFKNYKFAFKIAFGLGNPLGGTDFNNYEQIISPKGVLFPDETLRRIVGSGRIESAGTNFASILGISYNFMLKNNLIISPELQFRYGLNSVLSDSEWKTNIFRAGIAISYPFGKETPKQILKEPEVIEIKIVPPKVEEIIVKRKFIIDTLLINSTNIEQTIVTQTYPILPYIFFDSSSSEIKPIYKSNLNASEFNETKLPQDNLQIYYQILDLIGYRMKNNNSITLNINGVTDGYELNSVPERLKLGNQRAKSISEYLQNKWGIDKNRLITKVQEVPNLPTSTIYYQGFAENRRVELSSNSPELFEPVNHSKFLEFASTEKKMHFEPKFNNSENIKYWTLHLSAHKRIIANTNGEGVPGKIEIEITKELIDIFGKSASNKEKLKTVLQIVDKDNNVETKEFFIPINLETYQYELGRLNLIVFDFDKSELSRFNQDLIKRFTQSSIKPNSVLDITGSTDILGEKDYNFRLSQSRAINVNAYIRNIMPAANIRKVEGLGSNSLKYDNSLPEGRFYCRTVLIEVQTPLQKIKD